VYSPLDPLVETDQNKFNKIYQIALAYALHSKDHSARCFTTCQSKLSSITPIELSSITFSLFSSKSRLAFGHHSQGVTAVHLVASFQNQTFTLRQMYFPIFFE
jgi:hypothetical protein